MKVVTINRGDFDSDGIEYFDLLLRKLGLKQNALYLIYKIELGIKYINLYDNDEGLIKD